VRRLRLVLGDLWDRFSASDPGLIRLSNALNTVGSILLALLVMALLGTPVVLLVAGALGAMVASFAISDPQPRDQAVTLALGLVVGLAAVSVGAELFEVRAASDVVFVAITFVAVYVRRFGPRGTGLGLIGFQIYFVSQFTHADPAQLPRIWGVLAIGFGSAAVIRFGVVRATPQRTLDRLRHAFRARLGAAVDALTDLVVARDAPADDADSARLALRRRTVRLHQCALMIQARLEASTSDAETAALVERRIAGAEIAAERLGRLVLRFLDAPTTDVRDPALDLLEQELQVLRLLVARTLPGPLGAESSAARNRLLGYTDDERLPDAAPAIRDVFRALGETARAMLGLRMALGNEAEADAERDGPQTARSREELDTEDLCLRAEQAEAEAEPDGQAPPSHTTGLDRISTRLAFQVATGSGLAVLGGELLSAQRWYWAVLTCWVVFINTSSTGEILVRGYRRLAGTLIGVVAGTILAELVGGDVWVAFTLVVVCIFGMFFTAPLSYMLMSFFVTTMIGLLYTLLHTFSAGVLVLRIEETALGAACGFIAAMFVLPVRISAHTDEKLADVLDRLRGTLELTLSQLAGGPMADLLHSARDMDTALDALHRSAEPITHPASPFRARRRRARYIMGLLDACAYHARSLAAVAEAFPADDRIGNEAAFTRVAGRLDHNLQALVETVRTGRTRVRLEHEPSISALFHGDEPPDAAPSDGVGERMSGSRIFVRVQRHLERLDEGILGLARPLGLADADGDAEAEADASSDNTRSALSR
jgi:uncharacterized membrane protein YccC